jgi:hypothetical protein
LGNLLRPSQNAISQNAPSGGAGFDGFANGKARHEPMPLYGALRATCNKRLDVRNPYMWKKFHM